MDRPARRGWRGEVVQPLSCRGVVGAGTLEKPSVVFALQAEQECLDCFSAFRT